MSLAAVRLTAAVAFGVWAFAWLGGVPWEACCVALSFCVWAWAGTWEVERAC